MLDDLQYLDQFKVLMFEQQLGSFFNYTFGNYQATNQTPRLQRVVALSEFQSNIGLETLVAILKRLGLSADFVNYEQLDNYHNLLTSNTLFITNDRWHQADQLPIIKQLITSRANLELINCQSTNQELELLTGGLQAVDRNYLFNPENCQQLNNSFQQARKDIDNWSTNFPTSTNQAKQLANFIVGKSGYLIYANELSLVAHWWQMTTNQRAKNLCFSESIDQFADFGKEGWWSHPIEKNFAVIDLVSNRTPKTDNQYFFAKDRVLSGKIPHSRLIELSHSSLLDSFWSGLVLAELTAAYLAALNQQSLINSEIELRIF